MKGALTFLDPDPCSKTTERVFLVRFSIAFFHLWLGMLSLLVGPGDSSRY